MRLKYKGMWEVSTNAGLCYRRFKTKKRAFRNAVGLLKKTNCEVVVRHWYYRRGHRFLREWVAKEVQG